MIKGVTQNFNKILLEFLQGAQKSHITASVGNCYLAIQSLIPRITVKNIISRILFCKKNTLGIYIEILWNCTPIVECSPEEAPLSHFLVHIPHS